MSSWVMGLYRSSSGRNCLDLHWLKRSELYRVSLQAPQDRSSESRRTADSAPSRHPGAVRVRADSKFSDPKEPPPWQRPGHRQGAEHSGRSTGEAQWECVDAHVTLLCKVTHVEHV